MQKLMSYPKLRKENIIDIHGFPDPYQWIEKKLDSDEVIKWIKDQNSISNSFLAIPLRERIRTRLNALYNYEKYSAPFKYGDNYFFYHNSGLQNQEVLYMQETLESKPEVVLDPNTLSEDGTVALDSANFSDDGQFLAYSVSKCGTDWTTCYVKNMKTKEDFGEKLEWLKFTSFEWTRDNLGFFYVRFPEQKNIKEEDRGKEVSLNNNQKVYYHKLGTPQENDILIYQELENPNYFIYPSVSRDGKYLILNIYKGTDNEGKVYITTLDKICSEMIFNKIIDNFENEMGYVTNKDEVFYFRTNYQAKNKQIIKMDLKHPEKQEWKTLVAESKPLVQATSFNDKYLLLHYSIDVHDVLQMHNLENGLLIKNIEMPSLGTISFSCQKHQDEFFYKFTSFLYPGTIYRYSEKTQTSYLFKEIKVPNFDRNNFITKQVFYPSKDGTLIPMFIISKRDIKYSGDNAFFLYGYGGFNISINPSFNSLRLCMIENLNVSIAIANIRGGDEYGDFWHESAKKEKKQNCFDDFHCAAEYLITNNYTNPKKIAINGGSNGGLLVGACINQRPDLYGCAIASQGVFDMLRFHLFTIGYAWITEYGNPDLPEDFQNLIKYCPIHNVKINTQYPAVMIKTSDFDDRVVPVHAYKFISELQEKAGENNEKPLLLNVEMKTGHGAGKPTTKIIDEAADIYTFIAISLELKYEEN